MAIFSTKRAKSLRRKSFLSFECLEDRKVLAGNVTVSSSGGFLLMTGDSADNQVSITQNANGTLQLRSLDANTTFNGQAGPLNIAAPTWGSLIMMGDGNDVLQISGTAQSSLTLNGSTTIDLGNGNDILRVSNLVTTGSLRVTGGAGDDQFIAQRDLTNLGASTGFGMQVGGMFMLQEGLGNDTVSIRNSSVHFLTFLDAGAGNDTVDIRNTAFGSLALLFGNSGTDTLNNAGNTFAFFNRAISLLFETQTAIIGPVAVNDTATVAEGGSVGINVLGNDTSTSGALNASTVTVTQLPANGSVSVDATTGVITYTHSGSETTSDSFKYTVSDVNGNVSNVGTVSVTVTPVNDLPTLSLLNPLPATVITQEDTAVGPLAITIGDAETPLSALVLSATSSQTNVVADNGITFSGTGANRTVLITPVANASGDTTITLTVKDANGATATQTINLHVDPVNDLPTLTDPVDATLGIGDVYTANVAVSDVEDPSGTSLTVTGTSSDTTLVPNSNIVVSGNGLNRTVQVTPAAGQFGTATITLKVTDADGATSVQQFVVNVVASVRPTISDVLNLSTTEDTAVGTTVTVGDAETPVNSLQVTATSNNQAVVANSGIQVSTTGGVRTVTITPVANASGTATITLTVTDANGLTATDTFDVNVSAVNDAPIAVPDVAQTLVNHAANNVSVTGNVLTNDTDVDGPVKLVSKITINGIDYALPTPSVSVPVTQVTATTVFGANLVVKSNGDYVYTYSHTSNDQAALADAYFALLPADAPPEARLLSDLIDYTVTDGSLSDTSSLTVDLT